jgi:hypothetical protein
MNETLKRILKNIVLTAVSFSIIILIIFFAKKYFPQKIVAFGNDNVASVIYSSNSHIKTPKILKAVYISSWAAGSQNFREKFFHLIEGSEINAVVIDIKDYTGRISFNIHQKYFEDIGSCQNRIPDIERFIAELHDKNIYVIGRISSFQDSYLVGVHPEWAVKSKSGSTWRDKKGVAWLEAGAKPVWEYLVNIAKASYDVGFDELNFDYIRFPSDGNTDDIDYKWMNNRTKREVIKDFLVYIKQNLKDIDAPVSVDFFGYTTTNKDDLGIGQVFEDALQSVDFVYPMVYPSHFGKGFLGYDNPAKYPNEVIKYSMDHAIEKAKFASTTKDKIKPWLQAFDLGADYTPNMVRTQIDAVYEKDLKGWLLWNAGSEYDRGAIAP